MTRIKHVAVSWLPGCMLHEGEELQSKIPEFGLSLSVEGEKAKQKQTNNNKKSPSLNIDVFI